MLLSSLLDFVLQWYMRIDVCCLVSQGAGDDAGDGKGAEEGKHGEVQH